MHRRTLLAALLAISLVALTCYPVNTSGPVTKAEVMQKRRIDAPTKVHMGDGSLYIFEQGFHYRNDEIIGNGLHYGLDRRAPRRREFSIPLDSVVGMEYFDRTVTGSRAVAGLLLTGGTFFGSLITLVAIFGSCPTVYTHDGADYRLEAECFSYSIGSSYELPDLDRLEQRTPAEGRFALRVLNEALETHYIDRFRMAYVDHPVGTEAFATDDGGVILARSPMPAPRAIDAQGRDVTGLLRYRDNVPYAIDSAAIRRMFARGDRDWIELTLPVGRDAEEITLALRGRNSLENTVLLYDVMMRDQGLNVLDWSESLNGDMLYAWRMYKWYSSMSGIGISVERNGVFEEVGRITDTGPIAWKTVAAHVPIGSGHGDSVRVRLSFVPDGWHVDWIGFDDEELPDVEPTYVPCGEARGNGTNISSAVGSIAFDDGEYFVTYPGEWIDMAFDLPALSSGARTLFTESKGYYVEWVRPEWVRDRGSVRRFDIDEPEAISMRLAELWSTRKNSFEKQFYEYRVPTADPERPW